MGYSPNTLVFRDISGRVETITGASTTTAGIDIRVTRFAGGVLDMSISDELDGKKIVDLIFERLCGPDRSHIDLMNPETRKRFQKAD